MSRIIQGIQRIMGAICALLLLVLGLLVFYQASARYLQFLPSALWTEEIARGLLIWLVIFGAGWAAFENTHFRLGILETALGKIYDVIGCVATIMGGSYLVYSGLPFAERGLTRVSQVSGLPAAWVYSAIIVGGILILLGGTAQLYRLFVSTPSEA